MSHEAPEPAWLRYGPDYEETCDECSGEGVIPCPADCDNGWCFEGPDGFGHDCPECKGRGSIECPDCEGEGVKPKHEREYEPDDREATS